MKYKRSIPLLLAAALQCSPAPAQVEEVFSRHVQVFKPVGEFAQTLIKNAPASGDGWRLVDDQKTGFKLLIPEDAKVDVTPNGNRVLMVTLPGGPQKPAPVFRIDAFKPEEDDPTEIDPQYAADYAENYPELAFNGKFSVSDSGMVTLPKRKIKTRMAMVGGSHLQGAVPAFRLQCALLSKEQQLFLTFDCPERDWGKHAPVIARMLLGFELQALAK